MGHHPQVQSQRLQDSSLTLDIRVKFCNNVGSVEFEFGAKGFPIWSLDLDSLLDFAQSRYITCEALPYPRQSMHLQRGMFLKAKNKSFELYLSHWSSPSSFFTGSCTVFQIGLAFPERICDLSLPTLALTMVVFCLEKPTAIASRKCCPSSTRQIKTSFLLHWHSSYHCSKHIYSHPTATVGSGSNCLPTLTS